jgi:hypothetical protein
MWLDVVVALLGMSVEYARQWQSNKKNMSKDIAPSLAYVKLANVRTVIESIQIKLHFL